VALECNLCDIELSDSVALVWRYCDATENATCIYILTIPFLYNTCYFSEGVYLVKQLFTFFSSQILGFLIRLIKSFLTIKFKF